jgi:hypothetical protein
MKGFIKFSIISLVFILALHFYAAYLAGGRFDDNYNKFTMEAKGSLILGSSRATHGLNPKFILENKIANFAFDAFSSPFSKEYNSAIYSYLGDSLKSKGVVVIEVNPWTLSIDTSLKEPYREKDRILNKDISFGNKPNYGFLFSDYKHGWGKIIMDEVVFPSKSKFLQENGWLEVSLDMAESSIQSRKSGLLSSYRKKAEVSVVSDYRINSLVELVDTLNDFKKIFIVKLPVCSELLEIESSFFNEDSVYAVIQERLPTSEIIELKSTDLIWIDGHHVYKNSVRLMSQRLNNKIKQSTISDVK